MTIVLEGETHAITPEEVEISDEAKGDLMVSREGNLLVGLNVHITPELEVEGIAREFVNRIQNLRKDIKLDIQDRIEIYAAATGKTAMALEKMGSYIMVETLAIRLERTLPDGVSPTEINLDTETFPVYIRSVKE